MWNVYPIKPGNERKEEAENQECRHQDVVKDSQHKVVMRLLFQNIIKIAKQERRRNSK